MDVRWPKPSGSGAEMPYDTFATLPGWCKGFALAYLGVGLCSFFCFLPKSSGHYMWVYLPVSHFYQQSSKLDWERKVTCEEQV